MAKLNFGMIVNDARGKMNGVVYSRNKGGAYARNKVSPTQPRTPAQLAVRNSMSLNAKAWSGTLTDAQRGAWAMFAQANPRTNVFGASIILSGLAMYNALNQVLSQVLSPPISDPPADLSVPVIPGGISMNGTADGSTMEIETAVQAVVANVAYYVFATPYLAPGITPGKSSFRFVTVVPPTLAAITVDLNGGNPGYQSRFGAGTAGQKVWALLASVNTATGALTVAQKFSCVVT